MPSQEVLKQLLDDFVEREALVSEEIQVIKDEIEQLLARMEQCRRHLSTIGADRQKVLVMKARYLEGNFELPAAAPLEMPVQQSSPMQANLMVAPWPSTGGEGQPAVSNQLSANLSGPASNHPVVPPTSPLSLPLPEQDELQVTFEQIVPAQSASANPAVASPLPAPTAPPLENFDEVSDPGAPPKAALKAGAGKKNKSALSAILGPLRTAAAQLTNSQPPPPQPRLWTGAIEAEAPQSAASFGTPFTPATPAPTLAVEPLTSAEAIEDGSPIAQDIPSVSAQAQPTQPAPSANAGKLGFGGLGDPSQKHPMISETGSYVLPPTPMSTAFAGHAATQELPRPELPLESKPAPSASGTAVPAETQSQGQQRDTQTQPQAPPVDKVVELDSEAGADELDDNDPIKRINDELRSLFK